MKMEVKLDHTDLVAAVTAFVGKHTGLTCKDVVFTVHEMRQQGPIVSVTATVAPIQERQTGSGAEDGLTPWESKPC